MMSFIILMANSHVHQNTNYPYHFTGNIFLNFFSILWKWSFFVNDRFSVLVLSSKWPGQVLSDTAFKNVIGNVMSFNLVRPTLFSSNPVRLTSLSPKMNRHKKFLTHMFLKTTSLNLSASVSARLTYCHSRFDYSFLASYDVRSIWYTSTEWRLCQSYSTPMKTLEHFVRTILDNLVKVAIFRYVSRILSWDR